MKGGIVESEEAAVARQRVDKHVAYTNGFARNNRKNVGSGVFYAVRAEAI
jgi:hypothetical protein